jgi:nucleoside 2-deoxyribosyltransferase
MKREHRIFFAIPFDSATKNLYDRISCRIRKQYPFITTVIGNQEVGPSPEYSEIVSFKSQNRELARQFVAQIMEADIVIADLTHNNPNVHVELGIALMENKNILRVTGRSVSELGFDIRNLEVRQYKDEDQLLSKITAYLDTFLKIKRLPISKEFGQLYCEEPMVPIQLRGIGKGFDIQSNCPSNFVIRDGAVQVDFEILRARKPEDWFGIYFRAGSSPFMGSNLVYVRQNGMIEIAVYPGPHVIETFKINESIAGRQVLNVQFENNHLELQIGSFRFETDKLSHQTVGRVLPASCYADVDVHSAKMICRDTIEWDY